MSKSATITSWILQAIAAVIMLQTLFFKFSGAGESVYIFRSLGAEPWGRIGSGVIELIAAVLLLAPRTTAYGAALTMLVASGAILSHLLFLGIALAPVGDKGELFALAVTTLLCASAVLLIHRRDLPLVGALL
jgi:hypothetical protein